MVEEKKLGATTVRIEARDITDFEVDGFAFYAVPDLKLGTGFGTAIQARGGPEVRAELEELAPVEMGQAVVSGAGNLKAKHIIHAVGPQFLEDDREAKLRTTLQSTLRCAEEKGMKTLALPAMGAGFYMMPIDMCSDVMLDTIREHVSNGTGLEEITICVLDSKQRGAFATRLSTL